MIRVRRLEINPIVPLECLRLGSLSLSSLSRSSSTGNSIIRSVINPLETVTIPSADQLLPVRMQEDLLIKQPIAVNCIYTITFGLNKLLESLFCSTRL